jgi:hypothetical protein
MHLLLLLLLLLLPPPPLPPPCFAVYTPYEDSTCLLDGMLIQMQPCHLTIP